MEVVSNSDVLNLVGLDFGPFIGGLECDREHEFWGGIPESATFGFGEGSSDGGADDNVVGGFAGDFFRDEVGAQGFQAIHERYYYDVNLILLYRI